VKAPGEKAGKPAVKADRAAREAAALRVNLLKRKEQVRLREAAAKAKAEPTG
jgi:hypothetical protein